MDWNTTEYAMRFFGLTSEEELEDFCVEHNVPVRLYPDGSIESVGRQGPDGWKEALFTHHERTVGHRPDDPKEMEKHQKLRDKAEADEAKLAADHGKKLKDRVNDRKGAPRGRARTGVSRT